MLEPLLSQIPPTSPQHSPSPLLQAPEPALCLTLFVHIVENYFFVAIRRGKQKKLQERTERIDLELKYSSVFIVQINCVLCSEFSPEKRNQQDV